VTLPRWLLLLVAAWVIAFGIFRIVVALRPRPTDGPNFMRKGMYGRGPRTHALFGAIYLALGGVLIATAFGWAPAMEIAGCLGQPNSADGSGPDLRTNTPAGDSASSK